MYMHMKKDLYLQINIQSEENDEEGESSSSGSSNKSGQLETGNGDMKDEISDENVLSGEYEVNIMSSQVNITFCLGSV